MSDQKRQSSQIIVLDSIAGTKSPLHEEQSVINALRSGDHSAYDKIFLKYYNRTINFVCSFVKAHDEAEDIVEDIFVSLWINREHLDPHKNFSSYLYKIARNAVFNYLRSKKVRRNYLENVLHDDYSHSVDEEFIAKETKLLVTLAVENMPAQRKKVFSMSRQQGLSHDEIAQHLAISKKAVEKHMRLALSDINKVLSAFLMMFTI